MPRISSSLTRRSVVNGLFAAGLVTGLNPSAALALDEAGAKALVDKVVADINKVIASGKSQGAMIRDFERLLGRYADVNIIARSALGQDARRATPAQLRSFTTAFKGYLARKYGRRFREFIGGRVEVTGVRRVKSWQEVDARIQLQGRSPFKAAFLVSDKSGKNLFFDMIIENVSLRISERSEIGALLDANKGDIDGLIQAVQKAG